MELNNNYRIKFKDNEDTYTYLGQFLGIEDFANERYMKIKTSNYEVEVNINDILSIDKI